MAPEITIGSRVQFPIKDCPILIVEKIEEVLESIKGNQIDRQMLSCIWYDSSTNTFKRDEFYADTVYSIES